MSQECILCNSKSVYSLKGERIFIRCRECDLIFVPARFHLSPEDESARYRLHNNTLSNQGYVRMFLEKISLIRAYCPDISSVLDYGCGTEPVLAKLMKREGFDCDIYDPYFFPNFPDGSYDLVVSTEVFEHFRNVRAEISGIIPLLNPGSFLAVMTSFHDTVENFEDWWYQGDPTHISFFGMRTFIWISKYFGFRVVYTNKKNFIILRKE